MIYIFLVYKVIKPADLYIFSVYLNNYIGIAGRKYVQTVLFNLSFSMFKGWISSVCFWQLVYNCKTHNE